VGLTRQDRKEAGLGKDDTAMGYIGFPGVAALAACGWLGGHNIVRSFGISGHSHHGSDGVAFE
jgi:hypothetical protein